MSRKSRLKKKNKQKLHKRFDQVASEVEIENIDDNESDNKLQPKVSQPITGDKAKKNNPVSEESDSIIDAPTRKLISKDVRMIIFTLVGLALVLVAVRILEIKTNYISTFGDWLYKITNIQTM